jgi:hypothetical protein
MWCWLFCDTKPRFFVLKRDRRRAFLETSGRPGWRGWNNKGARPRPPRKTARHSATIKRRLGPWADEIYIPTPARDVYTPAPFGDTRTLLGGGLDGKVPLFLGETPLFYGSGKPQTHRATSPPPPPPPLPRARPAGGVSASGTAWLSSSPGSETFIFVLFYVKGRPRPS